MLRLRALECTILTIPHTCMYDTYKAIYKLSKLKYPNEPTNGRTDICTPRAAFAAEKRRIRNKNSFPLLMFMPLIQIILLHIFYDISVRAHLYLSCSTPAHLAASLQEKSLKMKTNMYLPRIIKRSLSRC